MRGRELQEYQAKSIPERAEEVKCLRKIKEASVAGEESELRRGGEVKA